MSATRSSLRSSGIPCDKRKEKKTKIIVNMTLRRSSENFHSVNTVSGTFFTSYQSMLSKLNDRHHKSTFDWALLVINQKDEFWTFGLLTAILLPCVKCVIACRFRVVLLVNTLPQVAQS